MWMHDAVALYKTSLKPARRLAESDEHEDLYYRMFWRAFGCGLVEQFLINCQRA